MTVHDASVEHLRATGTRLLMGLLWSTIPLLGIIGVIADTDRTLVTLLMVGVLLAVPTIMVRGGRSDATVRVALGMAATVPPIAAVLLLRGHAWQMDMHMAFFVALSMLILLCDWRPIVVAAALIAVHHLSLLFLLPEWVFPGSGSLGRVVLHAVLVIGESAILIATVRAIGRLTTALHREREDTLAARNDAVAARDQAVAALGERECAQAAADAAQAHAAHADARSAEQAVVRRRATADAIESALGAIARELRDAAMDLSGRGGQLTGVADTLVREARELGAVATATIGSVESVADRSDELASTISAIAGSAAEMQALAQDTAGTITALGPRLSSLVQETDAARAILDLVVAIAEQSNLLAINASIEAARSGEAGRGFGVVAGEMKAMARQTGSAATEIARKLEAIEGAATAFVDAIGTATESVSSIRGATTGIAAAVQQQGSATRAIAEEASGVRLDMARTGALSAAIGDAADSNRTAADHAAQLALALDRHAEQLGLRVEGLLDDLRAA